MPEARDAGSGSSPFDPLRAYQELGAQVAQAALAMAGELARSPAARFAEPMAQMSAQMAQLATGWVGPVRSLLEEQQELVDAIAAWAEQQRDLADRFAALAERHRAMTSATLAVMQPLLDHLDRSRADPGETPP